MQSSRIIPTFSRDSRNNLTPEFKLSNLKLHKIFLTEGKKSIRALTGRLWNKLQKYFRVLKQHHVAFLFFLLLATIAWFLRALSDEYVATIEYPVKYINLPPNRILSQPPPKKLILHVRSDGKTIIFSRMKRKRPLFINVNDFALYSLSDDTTSVYTLSKYTKEDLSSQLNLSNNNMRIIDIKPDTLIFNFSRVRHKKVPVRVNLLMTNELFEQQYMLNGTAFTRPDSITVTGPSYIIDTLSYILTEAVHFKNLSDTAEKGVKLKANNKLIYDSEKVRVIVPVDEFTEMAYSIPIEPHSVPDSLDVIIFPKNVQVKFIVTLTHFNLISPALFHAYVDFENTDLMGGTETSQLRISLDSLPPYIHSPSLKPRSVEFLIKKK